MSGEELATKAYTEHKTAFENWTYGEISKVWFDGDGILCVEYDSGKWYHHREYYHTLTGYKNSQSSKPP